MAFLIYLKTLTVHLVLVLAGGFLCMNPFGALISLGLIRRKSVENMRLNSNTGSKSCSDESQTGKSSWYIRPFFYFWEILSSGLKSFSTGFMFAGCFVLIMQLGWKFGWHNSFHKGYEDYLFGIVSSWLGIFGLVYMGPILMIANVHQEFTGSYSRAFEVSLCRKLLKKNPWGRLKLAMIFFCCCFFLGLVSLLPRFFENMMPDIEAWTDQEFRDHFWGYFYFKGIVTFVCCSWLFSQAASVYENANLVGSEKTGTGFFIGHKYFLFRCAGWLWAYLGRWASFFSPAIWLAGVFLIYILEFLNYHLDFGFLLNPLLILPWIGPMPF